MVGSRRAVIAWLALTALAAAEVRAEPVPLVFGVLNQQSPSLTAERWNPILTHVSRVADVSLRLRMGPSVERTNAMMAAGEFDLVFTNHNFRPEYDGLGLKVIARWGSELARAAIVVAEDSPAKRLAELAGRRVSFPSAHAFLGHAVPLAALKQAGITVEPVFAGNQEGALAQLKAHRVDAAAVNSRFAEQYAKREGLKLRPIHISEPFPDLAVVVHPRVAPEVVARVRRAFIGMSSDPGAQEILRAANCPGFAPADDTDYARVRAIYREAAE